MIASSRLPQAAWRPCGLPGGLSRPRQTLSLRRALPDQSQPREPLLGRDVAYLLAGRRLTEVLEATR
jgi:hypothetical protein